MSCLNKTVFNEELIAVGEMVSGNKFLFERIKLTELHTNVKHIHWEVCTMNLLSFIPDLVNLLFFQVIFSQPTLSCT